MREVVSGGLISIVFDFRIQFDKIGSEIELTKSSFVRLPNSIHGLSSITEHSIDYAGISHMVGAATQIYLPIPF